MLVGLFKILLVFFQAQMQMAHGSHKQACACCLVTRRMHKGSISWSGRSVSYAGWWKCTTTAQSLGVTMKRTQTICAVFFNSQLHACKLIQRRTERQGQTGRHRNTHTDRDRDRQK